MNRYNEEYNQLIQEHSTAKRIMILGIVFEGVAFVLLMIYISLAFEYYNDNSGRGWMVFFAIVFLGVGTPLLITGIKDKNIANSKINLLKKNYEENNYTYMKNGDYSQPQGMPYQPQGVPYQPQGVPYQPQGVPYQPQGMPYQPQGMPYQPQGMPYQPQGMPYQSQGTQSFVDIDWRKYNPLDAGVSYVKDKNYKFAHMDGFCGSVPQNFMDRTFPRCPICCSLDPYWNLSEHIQMTWKGNLFLFKCSHCQGIISMSKADVASLQNGALSMVASKSIGVTNMAIKAASGKQAGVIYAVIESVGNSGVTRECEGKEFKLDDLKDMCMRK